MALGAYRLKRRSAHPRVGGGEFEEAPNALDIGIAVGVEHGAFAHDIVDDDQRTTP